MHLLVVSDESVEGGDSAGNVGAGDKEGVDLKRAIEKLDDGAEVAVFDEQADEKVGVVHVAITPRLHQIRIEVYYFNERRSARQRVDRQRHEPRRHCPHQRQQVEGV